MNRPTSIIWFERLYLGSTLLWLIGAALSWQNTRAVLAQSESAGSLGVEALVQLYIGVMVFATILTLVLWYFTARARAVVAKWLVVACFAVGALLGLRGHIATLSSDHPLEGVIGIGAMLLTAAAVFLLFRRDSVEWFSSAT